MTRHNRQNSAELLVPATGSGTGTSKDCAVVPCGSAGGSSAGSCAARPTATRAGWGGAGNLRLRIMHCWVRKAAFRSYKCKIETFPDHPPQDMQTLKFDSIKQAAAALKLDSVFLKAARQCGCMAFTHGRIDAAALVDFLGANTVEVNEEVAYGILNWSDSPPRLRRNMVERMRRDIVGLAAKVTPGKRFVGREIAAAVRRELNDELAARLAGMAPDAAAVELRAVRERIVAA